MAGAERRRRRSIAMQLDIIVVIMIGALAALALAAGMAYQRVVSARLEEARRLLMEGSIVDPETGASSRRFLLERFGQEFQKARRHGSALACIAVGIDDFALLEERFGRDACARLLRQFADICRASARLYDIVGRYERDEFVLLLPDTDAPGAAAVAERIRRSIAGDLVINTGTCNIFVSMSAGVAALVPTDEGVDHLLRRAHEALAAARNSGKNRIVKAT
ncbi:MAG TPA: GGDEF domain-containing protein [Spirochaetota bacterium]|nr:GGDEF domain-containing protein [Spirochaetota bacterium]HNT12518.1 GGDEF domain-containing protein [Spirochaetota bacterium]